MMTKNDFIEEVLGITKGTDDDGVRQCLGSLYEQLAPTSTKAEMTKNGAAVLRYLQKHPEDILTAKAIGEEMSISSRTVSGSMRKLVTDNYVEKMGKNPSSYRITDKGINYQFDNIENL